MSPKVGSGRTCAWIRDAKVGKKKSVGGVAEEKVVKTRTDDFKRLSVDVEESREEKKSWFVYLASDSRW